MPVEQERRRDSTGGNDPAGIEISEYAWYAGNANGQMHEVGLKRPNAWNLFDMSGNVYEWCSDWYGMYSGESQIDPTGPSSGTSRVARGGSWERSDISFLRSAEHWSAVAWFQNPTIGLRVVMEYP